MTEGETMDDQLPSEDRPFITHLWSSYGHRFMSTGEEMRDRCLTCGAEYRLVLTPDMPWEADYVGADGDEPTECTGRTQPAWVCAACGRPVPSGCDGKCNAGTTRQKGK